MKQNINILFDMGKREGIYDHETWTWSMSTNDKYDKYGVWLICRSSQISLTFIEIWEKSISRRKKGHLIEIFTEQQNIAKNCQVRHSRMKTWIIHWDKIIIRTTGYIHSNNTYSPFISHFKYYHLLNQISN